MRNVIKKINETGTLLVEALAMLGLISMVTPVLYKKASERTVELQDINASSQLRALSTAMDSYLKDKFADISRGEMVNGINYEDFKDSSSASVEIPSGQIANVLGDYLPYGFLDNAGNLRETKLFNNYSIVIKSESELKDGKAVNQTLTSFIVIPPKNAEDFSTKRAARVASMVGSNGGYVTDNIAMGAQGIWSVAGAELGGNLADNTLVISSLQPISSQGLANEDVLHRHDELDASDELNSMTTDLFLSYGNEEGNLIGHNIRLVNQIIMTPNEAGMVDKATGKPANNDTATAHDDKLGDKYTTSVDNALYIGNKGGAYLEGVLKAMDDHFTVTDQGIRYFNDKIFMQQGDDPKYSDATFAVSGKQMMYGNPMGSSLKLIVNSGLHPAIGEPGASLDYAVPEHESTSGGVSGRSVLHADIDRVGIGGLGNYVAGSSNYSFNVIRDPSGNTDTPWNVVMGDSQNVWNGAVTKYVWNGDIPDGGTDDADHNYELSVNGSAYVRDTLLTAKLKTFDVDAATLRAGTPHEDLNTAEDYNFFFKVKSQTATGGRYNGALMVGDDRYPIFTIATAEDNAYDLPLGVVIHTDEESNDSAGGPGDHPGINITAGASAVPQINSNYVVSGVESPYATQRGMVKIGGSSGVYLSTMDGDDFTKAPVSIQGEMFRAYADWENTRRTIEEIVDTSILSSDRMRGSGGGDMGEREINDMHITVNDENGKTAMEIMPMFADNGVTGTDDNAVVRMIGRTAIYDHDYNPNNADDSPSFVAEKGKIMVKATAAADPAYGIQSGDDILVVDNNGDVADADRGSVYIRKGSINIDSARDISRRTHLSDIAQDYRDVTKAKGYIAADRFVAHYDLNDGGLETILNNGAGSSTSRPAEPYSMYEVNPAYTSVMHDIKLTTRGGARLSDILPDFINKGIYVVDTTYAPGFNWTSGSNMLGSEVTTAGTEVGEYLGFVPTPKCPPGYAKVVTLTPAGWSMAQAGTPAAGGGTLGYDIYTPSNIQDYIDDANAGEDVSNYVLRFQKSTWLKSLVRQYCGGQFKDSCSGDSTFQGWGAVMGFIYPAYMYGGGADEVAWNVFPVYYKELEGYATVYCYFDRDSFSSEFVYTGYDQLNQINTGHLNSWDKNSDNNPDTLNYLKRLDDPALKYQSPW